MINTPVLLICFNRADHASQVLAKIVEAKPKDLYVFRDHWRENRPGEQEKCEEVRALIEEIGLMNKDITLHTLYPDHNLGCGPGPMTALNWFFSENEMGIIFEDDAVPHPDFFPYCEELLNKYKDDESVYTIGSMRIDTRKYGDGSYYFTMQNRNLCAWASWHRAWNVFDYELKDVTKEKLNDVLKNYYHMNLRMREKWCERLDILHNGQEGNRSWDMQFFISIWMHHGKGIFPNATLSSNIGFDECATHIANPNNVAANRPLEGIMPLTHPTSNKIVRKADIMHDSLYTQPQEYGWSGLKRLPYRVNKRIKKYFGVTGSWKNFLLSKLR